MAVDRAKPVATWVATVTFAFGITAADGSVTVPERRRGADLGMGGGGQQKDKCKEFHEISDRSRTPSSSDW